MAPVSVLLEVGSKRSFASALDHPGWARSGRSEADALEALESYRSRYHAVLERSGLSAPTGRLVVTRTVPGDASTDFGVPHVIVDADRRPLTKPSRERLVATLDACWLAFDVGAAQPVELRLGPRGGGRSFEKLCRHVTDAEVVYAKALGARVAASDGDPRRVEEIRAVVRALLRAQRVPDGVPTWPLRYGARRIAWHVLDHLFELEDRADGA